MLSPLLADLPAATIPGTLARRPTVDGGAGDERAPGDEARARRSLRTRRAGRHDSANEGRRAGSRIARDQPEGGATAQGNKGASSTTPAASQAARQSSSPPLTVALTAVSAHSSDSAA